MSEKKAVTVSRRFAMNEFRTIGLVLILYCLLVLYLPIPVNEFLAIKKISKIWILDVDFLVSLVTLVLGTFFPFLVLKIAYNDVMPPRAKVRVSFLGLIANFVVFFAAISASIFLMTVISNFFNIPGQLVSGIGVSIDIDKLNDYFYIATFIFISPFLEEYAFRGVLLHSLGRYGKSFALYASAICFALAHGSFSEFLPSLVMGIILGKQSLRYKSYFPGLLLHICFNLFLYLLFIVPEGLGFYISLLLCLVYVIAFFLVLTRQYEVIRIRKGRNIGRNIALFLSSPTVIIALLLFVGHSVLIWIL